MLVHKTPRLIESQLHGPKNVSLSMIEGGGARVPPAGRLVNGFSFNSRAFRATINAKRTYLTAFGINPVTARSAQRKPKNGAIQSIIAVDTDSPADKAKIPLR
jgi:hypothetical protein